MTSTEVVFPIGATTQELVDKNGTTYDVSDHTVTRTGEDGAIPILHLFVGDSFNGEILEGGWKKGWHSNIDTFTASIDSGILRLTGVAKVAGTAGSGWINSYQPIPLLDELELTVSMEVPVDDTGAVASRDTIYQFYLKQDKDESNPALDDNFLRIYYNVDETGLIIYLQKEVNGANTLLASGYDYTMDTTRSTGDLEATIWRLVFNGKPGTTGATMSVYLKQSDALANAESATEHEVTGSPFDVSDLAFNIAYPSFRINTLNTTYFGTAYDSANRAASSYLRVKYPQFDVNWSDDTITDDSSVMLFDGDPDSGGVRVYDKDHTFTDDAYLQNGLIRLKMEELTEFGDTFYVYYNSTWNRATSFAHLFLESDGKTVKYPELLGIQSDPTNPEVITLRYRFHEDAVSDTDYYIDVDMTLRRGSYVVEWEIVQVHPLQNIHTRLQPYAGNRRFMYVGDDYIRDDDVDSSTVDNDTMSDNYIIAFDDTGHGFILGCATKLKPDGTNKVFRADDGDRLEFNDYVGSTAVGLKLFILIVPFSDIAHLFKEAEDATISASAREWLVGSGDDTETEGDSADWVATNCVITDDADSVVGTQSIKITSSGAGRVRAKIPVDNLKITKFDSLKFYVKTGAGGVGDNILAEVRDTGGSDANLKRTGAFGQSTSWVLKTLSLPHSDTDEGNFNVDEGAGYNFNNDLDAISFRWQASAANEEVYIDGLHLYIGTTTTRGRGETLSGGEAVVLDAQNEYCDMRGTDAIPEARYLVVYRAKDTDQVVSDGKLQIYNNNDTKHLNKENAIQYETLTSSFASYVRVFDISSGESGDLIRRIFTKALTTENTILVDNFLIIPLSDGMNLPMDLAHGSLYDINTETPVDIDSLKTDYIGIKQDGAINFFGGLQQKGEALTLDDDETYNLPRDVNGFGFIQVADNEEYAWFFFNKDGEVTLAANSANVDNADTDGKFCIYDGGDYVVLKNRLGSTRKIRYMTWSE